MKKIYIFILLTIPFLYSNAYATDPLGQMANEQAQMANQPASPLMKKYQGQMVFSGCDDPNMPKQSQLICKCTSDLYQRQAKENLDTVTLQNEIRACIDKGLRAE